MSKKENKNKEMSPETWLCLCANIEEENGNSQQEGEREGRSDERRNGKKEETTQSDGEIEGKQKKGKKMDE